MVRQLAWGLAFICLGASFWLTAMAAALTYQNRSLEVSAENVDQIAAGVMFLLYSAIPLACLTLSSIAVSVATRGEE